MERHYQKMQRFYAQEGGAPIVQQEFGFYSLDRWRREGHLCGDTNLNELFGFDAQAKFELGGLGWCEAAFLPAFEERVLEDRGEHELVQDCAGRSVLCFKGRRSGFMPEYVDHPVKDLRTWEENVRWRLDPDAPGRLDNMEERMQPYLAQAQRGGIICQNVIGGYMYLRSLIGPADLLYRFYDDPQLIPACMESWLALADRITAAHQAYLPLDELFLAEDICYNHGLLISPDMMREFLFPYYQQLIANTRRRNRGKPLHLQIDTDGHCQPAIPLYQELGMDYLSPFEVASGCDVVALRRQYPDLLMRGGIDKRILAQGPAAIDAELDRIMPFMVSRGGYIPCCDHGVPEEVSFENYLHYRKRMAEY
ncbi:MAG: uroporphyrinogen decarboxylase family protein [Eubacteriales bacterium]|nr:uroporphyrinogen decarboxylase family protein [Eubacteriales bacterium]